MKFNRLFNASPPVIAYLDKHSLQFHASINGNVSVNHYALDYDVIDGAIEGPLAIPNHTNSIIILAESLLLYSQQSLPVGLRDHEVAELITAQKSAAPVDASFLTCFDYFHLEQTDHSVIYGVFEARKDRLDSVIQLFTRAGSTVSLVIPGVIVIINQILVSQAAQSADFYTVIRMKNTVFIARINKAQITRIDQVHANPNNSFSSIYVDLELYFAEIKASRIFVVGLEEERLTNQDNQGRANAHDFNVVKLDQSLENQCMEWMTEQYDSYQSVALA